MALNTRMAVVARNAQLDTLAPLFNSGLIRIYDGSQPATPETAVSSQNLLAELTFSATAFGSANAGAITANAVTDDTAANATGTASWARFLKSDGTTVLADGSVDTATANVVMNSTAIQVGARVSVTSLTISLPMQGA